MRILHLNLEKGWRGGERQTLLTLDGLRAGGHEVALAARAGGPLARRAVAAGIPVFECGGTLGLVRILLTKGQRFDVLHAQTAQTMSLLAALRPLLRAALVFTRRTAFDAAGTEGRHRWKWAKADALVAISEAAAAAPRALGLSVVVVPSAVQAEPTDSRRMHDLRTRFGLDGRRVLVTAAALSPEKDPLTLIGAVDILRRTHPDVLCLHCGADGAAADAARARVAELGLADHYRFAGFLPHVADALALADVYVSSSRFEALGTSVLDACLVGLPIVATDVGGHREILAPDRGLLVPAGDAAALARRITWVLAHPDAARAMGARAQAMVQRDYAVAAMVARYERLYRGLRRA
ncbi:MAG: glycosyltransferase family 4 protein [Castellaniella sp.]|uniref:glycosyltransferase family 4 protein n=1 Tax=Castellaniella sp. TaxID=1955812 RepID=UPI002A35D3E0|nr:glycosyltransferase family 4 protein [Castellaniella sp.]MDY0309484.1 glycosyltransferase family 4 protein [Castellaniella sp.]